MRHMHINTMAIKHSEETGENTKAIKTQISNKIKYQYTILFNIFIQRFLCKSV